MSSRILAWSSALSTIASGQGSPYFSSRSLSSEPALTPMRIEQPWSLRRLDHLAHALGRADVAGIDAQAGGAALGRLDRALVVEMDVGDDRHLRPGARSPSAPAVDSWSGQETRTMSAPARSQRLDLRRPSPSTSCGQRVGHGLHGDRRVAADRHLADMDLPALAPLDVAIGSHAHRFHPCSYPVLTTGLIARFRRRQKFRHGRAGRARARLRLAVGGGRD